MPFPTTLLQLPPGVWQIIFRHLGDQEAAALRLACSSTRLAVDQHLACVAIPLLQVANSQQGKQPAQGCSGMGCGLAAGLSSLLRRFAARKNRSLEQYKTVTNGLVAVWPALEAVCFRILPADPLATWAPKTVRNKHQSRHVLELPASAMQQHLHGMHLRSLRLEPEGYLRGGAREARLPLGSTTAPKFELTTSILTSLIASACRHLVTLHLVGLQLCPPDGRQLSLAPLATASCLRRLHLHPAHDSTMARERLQRCLDAWAALGQVTQLERLSIAGAPVPLHPRVSAAWAALKGLTHLRIDCLVAAAPLQLGRTSGLPAHVADAAPRGGAAMPPTRTAETAEAALRAQGSWLQIWPHERTVGTAEAVLRVRGSWLLSWPQPLLPVFPGTTQELVLGVVGASAGGGSMAEATQVLVAILERVGPALRALTVVPQANPYGPFQTALDAAALWQRQAPLLRSVSCPDSLLPLPLLRQLQQQRRLQAACAASSAPPAAAAPLQQGLGLGTPLMMGSADGGAAPALHHLGLAAHLEQGRRVPSLQTLLLAFPGLRSVCLDGYAPPLVGRREGAWPPLLALSEHLEAVGGSLEWVSCQLVLGTELETEDMARKLGSLASLRRFGMVVYRSGSARPELEEQLTPHDLLWLLAERLDKVEELEICLRVRASQRPRRRLRRRPLYRHPLLRATDPPSPPHGMAMDVPPLAALADPGIMPRLRRLTYRDASAPCRNGTADGKFDPRSACGCEPLCRSSAVYGAALRLLRARAEPLQMLCLPGLAPEELQGVRQAACQEGWAAGAVCRQPSGQAASVWGRQGASGGSAARWWQLEEEGEQDP